MAQRTVKPERVATLKEWVSRWPKATNLGFDEETREPVVFSVDEPKTRVGSFPWRREGDTMTILSQPALFSQQATAAARKRFDRIVRERNVQMRAAGEEAIRGAISQLLETRRTYDAATPTVRAGMRRDVLTAERAVRDLEAAMASELYPEREFYNAGDLNRVYNPPMPLSRRGIPLNAVAGDEEKEDEQVAMSSKK
jgi:hypothetical protein